jgi:phosphoenolpyruvate synthase/pyruvate phosphate dikinase
MKKIEKDLVILGSLITFLQASGIKTKDHIKDYDGTLMVDYAEIYLPDTKKLEKKAIKLANEYYQRIKKKLEREST